MSNNEKKGLQLILFKGVIFATVLFFAVVFLYFDNEQENSDDKTREDNQKEIEHSGIAIRQIEAELRGKDKVPTAEQDILYAVEINRLEIEKTRHDMNILKLETENDIIQAKSEYLSKYSRDLLIIVLLYVGYPMLIKNFRANRKSFKICKEIE